MWQEILDCIRDLEKVNAYALKLGRDMVQAEADYYTAKAEAAFELKEAGNPVSFIALVLKGGKTVAKAMTAYHIAQIEYDNARECVNVIKKKLTALNDQYQREWNQAGMRDL